MCVWDKNVFSDIRHKIFRKTFCVYFLNGSLIFNVILQNVVNWQTTIYQHIRMKMSCLGVTYAQILLRQTNEIYSPEKDFLRRIKRKMQKFLSHFGNFSECVFTNRLTRAPQLKSFFTKKCLRKMKCVCVPHRCTYFVSVIISEWAKYR